MQRRDFLKLTAGTTGLALLAPGSLLAGTARWNRTLVLVQLAGGNDGLNTVVPFADPSYGKLRPRLALGADRVLRLSDTLGLHPALEGLMPAWKAGDLGVALGVGYENPNRSHFRSTDVWTTGSSGEEVLEEGWLARVFADEAPPPSAAADGLLLGKIDPGPLAGPRSRAVALARPERFLRQARRVAAEAPSSTGNPALDHLLRVREDVGAAASNIEERMGKTGDPSSEFPKTALGRQFALATRLLESRVGAPVITVTHGGFDTHARQAGTHERLLRELGDSLGAFRDALEKRGLWNDTLVATWSEFGRRAAENGSGGSDHGTAAPHFLLGGRVQGGFVGAQPSLTQLQGGDLVHALDFRRLNATYAKRWWGLTARSLEARFRPLDVLG